MINKTNIPSFESQMGQIQEAKRIMEELKIREAIADNELTKELCYIVTHEDHGYTYVSPGHYIDADIAYEETLNIWIISSSRPDSKYKFTNIPEAFEDDYCS